MSAPSDPRGNGRAIHDVEAELDRLVDEALTGLKPAEPPIDEALSQLARRLREHPDRAALLDRLRREVLAEEGKATQEMPPGEVPPSKE
jgi:hypothetical protein